MALPAGYCKGVQALSGAFSGTLHANLGSYVLGGDTYFNSESVSCAGASASISFFAKYQFNPMGEITWISGGDNAKARAAAQAWYDGGPANGYLGYAKVFAVSAAAPGAVDTYYIANGWYGGEPEWYWYGATEANLSYTLGSSLIKAWHRLVDNPPTDYALRDVRQRNYDGGWWWNASTTITATCGSATATGNAGAAGEADCTTAATTLGISISLNTAPSLHTDYASVTVNGNWSGYPVAVDLSKITKYIDTHTVGANGHDGSIWHFHGSTYQPLGYTAAPPADADTKWKTVVTSGAISIQRCAGSTSTGPQSISGGLSPLYFDMLLRLGKAYHPAGLAADSPYRYNSYIDTVDGTFIGYPFEIGLYHHWKADATRQTDAEVSVAPSWSAVHYQELWPWTDFVLPDDVWRVFTNAAAGIRVYLRGAWCAANNEDVPFTDPLTMATVTPIGGATPVNVLQACVIPNLTTGLLSDPHCDGESAWMTFARTELNLDKPDGTNRPSEWTVGAVPLSPQTTWVVPTGGVTIERTLATRRRNRATRFSAHLWTGAGDQQEVSHEWPYMTLANYAGANPTTGDIPDDPKWWDPNATPWPGEEVGCLYEDITDWRSFSILKLAASGATVDIPVTLTITYRETSAWSNDSRYLGATYNFGSEGDADWQWTAQKTLVITGTLASATGEARFDLAPNAGQLPANPELVEQVQIAFGAVASEQTLTSVTWGTVLNDAENSSGTPARMRIAHKFGTDPFGATSFVEGMPNYCPAYIDSLPPSTWRNERGFAHTQSWQHNPDSEATDNPTVLNSLATWYNRWSYSEHLTRPTWHADRIAAVLTDVDGATLGTPMFGDYEETGFALKAGQAWAWALVICDVILQGAWRGIAKDAGVREPNLASTALELYYSDDGVTKTLVETKGTDADGAYTLVPVREKTPRVAYLKGSDWYGPQQMVNAEWFWAVSTSSAYGNPAMTHRSPIAWIAVTKSTGLKVRPLHVATWTSTKVLPTAPASLSIEQLRDGRIVFTYERDSAVRMIDWQGGVWGTEVSIVADRSKPCKRRIVPTDDLMLAYNDGAGNLIARRGVWTGTAYTWQAEVTVATDAADETPAVELLRANTVHIAYKDTGGALQEIESTDRGQTWA